MESPDLLILAQVASRWSTRPSQILELTGTQAWQIDLAAAVRMTQWEEQQRKVAEMNRGS